MSRSPGSAKSTTPNWGEPPQREGCHCACRQCPRPVHSSHGWGHLVATKGRPKLSSCPWWRGGGTVRDPQGHLINFPCGLLCSYDLISASLPPTLPPHSWSKFRNIPGTCEYGTTEHLAPWGRKGGGPSIQGPQQEKQLEGGIPRFLSEEGLGTRISGS